MISHLTCRQNCLCN